MKTIFKILMKNNRWAIMLIILLIIVGGSIYQIQHKKILNLKDKYDSEVKLKNALIDTVEIFKNGEAVDVTGISKGKGFSGVIKRHGFSRGPASHGSDHHREPGSIGSMFPQRVVKGRKLPGRMGRKTVTIRNLKVIKVDSSRNLLCVAGAVPGAKNELLLIRSKDG